MRFDGWHALNEVKGVMWTRHALRYAQGVPPTTRTPTRSVSEGSTLPSLTRRVGVRLHALRRVARPERSEGRDVDPPRPSLRSGRATRHLEINPKRQRGFYSSLADASGWCPLARASTSGTP